MGKAILRGLTKEVQMDTPVGVTLLHAAVEQGLDWSYRCMKGTCARCRCLVEDGAELLNEATDAEWNRLEAEEFEQGFRLACQAVVEADGNLRVSNKPYL